MIKFAALLVMLPGATLIGACAQQPAGTATSARSAGNQCFLADQVNGYSKATDTSVAVQVGANNYYRLDLSGTCTDINWANSLVLRTVGGGSWICDAADAEIIVPGRLGGSCLVTGVHPITKAEWLATPK